MFHREHQMIGRYFPIPLFIGMGLLLMLYVVSCNDKSLPIAAGVAQLFVDDYMIESRENLKRTLHQPVKDFGGTRPIIALDNEFEGLGATLQAQTIVYDPGIEKYVMFALAFSPEWRSFEPERRWEFYRLYRYTSADGMNWVKGDDGKSQCVFPRSHEDLYDPESGEYALFAARFSCYYNDNNAEYPYQAWQGFNGWGERKGLYYLRSRDGIYWERGKMVVDAYEKRIADSNFCEIHQDGRDFVGPLDNSIFYYDEIENRFLGIFKFISREKVEYDNRLRSRAYAFFSPPLENPFDINQIDHVDLVPPAAEKNNDKPWDEYYASNAWRYESIWLGGLKVWHKKGDYSWSAAGCAFLKLVSSRNGLNWSKVPFPNDDEIPEIFIPNGPEGGNNGQNDGGYITSFTQGPLRINNQLIYYYGCSSFGKNKQANGSIKISGGGIFRARLRIDGFVSINAGQVTTKLLSYDGDNLFINSAGPVTVEVIDADGVLLGLQTVRDDALRHQVNFKGRSLRETANSGNAHLRFTIGKGGRLYSFTIGNRN
jgi:hypothetical protein